MATNSPPLNKWDLSIILSEELEEFRYTAGSKLNINFYGICDLVVSVKV